MLEQIDESTELAVYDKDSKFMSQREYEHLYRYEIIKFITRKDCGQIQIQPSFWYPLAFPSSINEKILDITKIVSEATRN
jgi:hypothetical protein